MLQDPREEHGLISIILNSSLCEEDSESTSFLALHIGLVLLFLNISGIEPFL